MSDILIKNVSLKEGELRITGNGIFQKKQKDDFSQGFCASWDWLPLATAIPVPEHGDLIDRDAVLNELKKYYKVGEVAEVGEVACFIDDAEVVLERTT